MGANLIILKPLVDVVRLSKVAVGQVRAVEYLLFVELGLVVEQTFGGQEALQFLRAGAPVGAQSDHVAGQGGHQRRVVVGTGHQSGLLQRPQVA